MLDEDPTFMALLHATRHVLETMAMLDLNVKGCAGPSNDSIAFLDVTTLIPLEVDGVTDRILALSLSDALARRVVAAMLGIDEEKIDGDADLLDGVGELGNMVAGVAKGALAGSPAAFSLSLPETFRAEGSALAIEGSESLYRGANCSVAGEPLRMILQSASSSAGRAVQSSSVTP